MKILVGLLGLTVGLALPLFGQEPQAVSADVRSQVEAVVVKFQDAYNARNAEGMVSTMTQDAVEMRSWAGLAIGKQAVVGRFLQDLKEGPGQMVNTILQMYPVGADGVCVIADSHLGLWKAQTMTLYVRSVGVWKSKMSYVRGP
jgi:ketosteroid isomerase-like protein